MHIRLATITRQDKSYRYAQIVESYRRSDGMPAHRVIANLGQLSDPHIENIKLAIEANRHGQRVIRQPLVADIARPQANLRYLDLAVLLCLWREWGLDRVLGEILPQGEADVACAKVVVALVLQRCVDPGSKLYAERWFPRTSLPELLAIEPASFNNTRLHRVLEHLDAATPTLMERLPPLYLNSMRTSAFATLYMDVTDATFVGHGPSLAVRTKTKEGLILRKIGIVLLCNERGWPLRWKVVAGNTNDCTAMKEMFSTVAQTPWVKDTPIFCDRAMGRTTLVNEILAMGVRLVTSLTTTEFETYAPGLPHQDFCGMDVPGDADEQAQVRAIDIARRQAQEAGLERATENLWVCDLGLVKVGASMQSSGVEPKTAASTVREALELCRTVEQEVADGLFPSFNAADRARGLRAGATKKYRLLGRLPQDVQDAILRGQADGCSLGELFRLAQRGDPQKQRLQFAALVDVAIRRSAKQRTPARPKSAMPVRVVAYFNPERFVEQRLNIQRQQAHIAGFVRDLNERLANPRSRLDRAGILAAVDRRLRRDDLLDAYRVCVSEQDMGDRVRYRVSLEPVPAAWERRRRYHGFTVLVAHPELEHSAAELCRLYRAKDAIEKDFQVIKSLVKIRPIRHRTDVKVSAHVTLCMLALLLERTIEYRLRFEKSAQAAIEILSNCNLNLYRSALPGTASVYTLTEANAEQRRLVRKLRMERLVNETEVTKNITPRLYLQ